MRASEVGAEHIKGVFFRAMQKGWAFGGKAMPVKDSPGVKRLEHREGDGDWFVRDEYSTTRGPKSGGITRIWFRNILVWEMHYWGEYEEKAISILKAVLGTAYTARHFFGGRGTPFVREGGLLYENDYHGTFKNFHGRERVINVTRQEVLGYHQYSGMLMVDLPLNLEDEDEL